MEIINTTFSKIDLNDSFFDDLRQDYLNFNKWFKSKANDNCYYVKEFNKIVGFLYLKIEDINESYIDIIPSFTLEKRLKIGTFKVSKNNCGLGTQFINLALKVANDNNINSIYFTILNDTEEKSNSIPFFIKKGFRYYGNKGIEEVYELKTVKNIKVISILEPWASLIKENVKHIETRSWATKYRGELYIHASKRKLTKNNFIEYTTQLSLLPHTNFYYGCIIAKCKLADCKIMTEELIDEVKKNNNEYICGEYKVGRYAWILEDIEVLNIPLDAKGQLGIWNYKIEKNLIRSSLRK